MGRWVDRGSWIARRSLTCQWHHNSGLVGGAAALAEVYYGTHSAGKGEQLGDKVEMRPGLVSEGWRFGEAAGVTGCTWLDEERAGCHCANAKPHPRGWVAGHEGDLAVTGMGV